MASASGIDKIVYLNIASRALQSWDIVLQDSAENNYVKLGGTDSENLKPAGIYVGVGNETIEGTANIVIRMFGVCRVRVTESVSRGDWLAPNPTIAGYAKKARSLQEGVIGYAVQNGTPGALINCFVTCIPAAKQTGAEIREDASLVKSHPEFIDFVGYDFDCISENQYHESYGGEKHGVRIQINRVALSAWGPIATRPASAEYGALHCDTATNILYQWRGTGSGWVAIT